MCVPSPSGLSSTVATETEPSDQYHSASTAIRQLGPQVLSYLSALLRSEPDAHEVFSQFAEDLWKGLPGYRGESSLRGWAYRIAWNASARFVRDPYRQRGRRLELKKTQCGRTPPIRYLLQDYLIQRHVLGARAARRLEHEVPVHDGLNMRRGGAACGA